MKQVLVLRLLRWTLLLAQMWMLGNAGTSEDVWKRAESYDTISRTLENLVDAEKSLNLQYLRERSEKWFQAWKNEVQRSTVYQGYLACSPEQVLHVISLIRSKLESDAQICMGNMIAEYEDVHNESVKVSQAAQRLAQSLQSRTDLESDHFDAILECLPDLKSNPSPGAYTPHRVKRVAETAPTIISRWRTFRKSFQESRGACFDFYSLEYHGTTADIVYLFEECVRGDMKDWIHAESGPVGNELHTFFKIILQHAYTRPAEFKRTLTGTFNHAVQTIITNVRKSHVAQVTELIDHYESRNRSAAECTFYLPRLKMLYSDLIRNAYRCLHGTYMNYLDSKKLIELDADDINRLTTNSSHQTIDLQRHNITVQDAVYHLQNKVIPTYETAKRKDLEMERQYDNDVSNIKTHLEKAFDCVQKTKNAIHKVSHEFSMAYTKCPDRITKQMILIKKLESDHPSHVFHQTDTLYAAAHSNTHRVIEKWRDQLERLLTVVPDTTPVCQTHCATTAYAQIAKLHDDSRSRCSEHLKKVQSQLKEAAKRAKDLRKLIINEGEEDLAKQCHHHAILQSNPTAEKFQINSKSCGEVFASRRESRSIIGEFRNCFKLKCFRTWRYYIFESMWTDDEAEVAARIIL